MSTDKQFETGPHGAPTLKVRYIGHDWPGYCVEGMIVGFCDGSYEADHPLLVRWPVGGVEGTPGSTLAWERSGQLQRVAPTPKAIYEVLVEWQLEVTAHRQAGRKLKAGPLAERMRTIIGLIDETTQRPVPLRRAMERYAEALESVAAQRVRVPAVVVWQKLNGFVWATKPKKAAMAVTAAGGS